MELIRHPEDIVAQKTWSREMLTIHFGEMPDVKHGPTWFKYNYDPEWFKDPFVHEMILGVDNSHYVGELMTNSPVRGLIPPELLSRELQTLIMIYGKPELCFNVTSCGENCAPWLLEIGKRKDVTVNLEYLMTFETPFEIRIKNEDRIVEDEEDYLLTAMKYV